MRYTVDAMAHTALLKFSAFSAVERGGERPSSSRPSSAPDARLSIRSPESGQVEMRGEYGDVLRCSQLVEGSLKLAERFEEILGAWIDPTGTKVLVSGEAWSEEIERAASKLGVDVQLHVEPQFQQYVEVYYEPRGMNGPDDWCCFYRRS